MSNIQLSGSAANFSALVTALQAANYFSGHGDASLQAGGNNVGEVGYIDSFQVSSSINVPEPVTLVRRRLSRRSNVTS